MDVCLEPTQLAWVVKRLLHYAASRAIRVVQKPESTEASSVGFESISSNPTWPAQVVHGPLLKRDCEQKGGRGTQRVPSRA